MLGQVLVHQTFGLVLLGPQRGLELAAALDQRGQAALGLGVGRGGLGLGGATEGREDALVDGIGFGPPAGRAGELTHAQRVGDGDGQTGLVQGGDEGALVAAGGFEHDVDARHPAQGGDGHGVAWGGVGQGVMGGGKVEVESGLGDIDGCD